MAPRLTICRCCATGRPVYACCEVCEARQLERVLEKAGHVAREHPSTDAWDRLVEAFHDSARLDRADATDRAWSAR